MCLLKSLNASIVTLLLLGAFSFSGGLAHAEEHSLNAAHSHSHNGRRHTHEHGASHHTISPAPLIPAKEQQYLFVPEHRFSGDGQPFSPVLLSGCDLDAPAGLISVIPTGSPASLSVSLTAPHSGRAPPL